MEIYQRPCRHCSAIYVWQHGCKNRACATGTVIKSCFFMVKKCFFCKSFCKRFLSSSLTTFFALMGFEQIREHSKISCKPKQQPKRHRLLHQSTPKSRRRRRRSGLMNLNFDSSTCLWLPKVLVFGIKCSVFGRSFFSLRAQTVSPRNAYTGYTGYTDSTDYTGYTDYTPVYGDTVYTGA